MHRELSTFDAIPKSTPLLKEEEMAELEAETPKEKESENTESIH